MPKVPRAVFLLAVCGLAFVALLSGVAFAAQTGQQSGGEQATIGTNPNSTNYLAPTEAGRDQYREVSIDVATAVDSSARELHAEHEIRSFEREIQSTDDPETVARDRLEALRQRYRDLDDRQESVFERYGAGEMTDTQLFRELVRLDTAITTQQSVREAVSEETDPSEAFLREFNSLEQSLTPEQPVTELLREAKTGSREPVPVYTEATADALVLATIVDDTYHRQATLRGERNLGGEDQFVDLWRDATNRAGTLYPWAFSSDNLRDLDVINLQVFSQVYAVRAQHAHGELTVYLDGATRNVFHENQRKPVQNQPVSETVRNETGEVVLTAELTNPAGPMRVVVTDSAGVPIENASVRVGGDPVGSTDSNGELWVIQPGDGFDLGVTTAGNESVSVQVADDPGS